jgi:YD repeat-containing protein
MMVMKKSLLFSICMIVCSVLFGQSYVAPSPDALGLARIGNTPVNYYSGTPSITIPLGNVPGKELYVPVNLTYNGSGFKVQEVAGVAGLGWNLSAGGVITRVTRGTADNLTNGWCSSTAADEPDMFIFNLMGQSGKFLMKAYNNILILPYRKITVTPGICGPAPTNVWEIVDENGTRFTFGDTEASRETTTITPKTGATVSYVSSWYLTKVTNANGTDVIQFAYTNGSVSTINYFFTQTKDPCHNDEVTDLTSTQTIKTVYVSQITTASGTASFTYSTTARKDAPEARRLDGFSVVSATGRLVSKYRLMYDYFQASPTCTAPECYRLKLTALYDLAPDPLFTFAYNEQVKMPTRYSQSFDHWGYYNDNTVLSWLPALDSRYVSGTPPSDYSFSGASREPSNTKADVHMISTITDRMGGIQKFVFESHTAAKDGQNVTVGGARIRSIVSSNGNGNSIQRVFRYAVAGNAALSSGALFKIPRYGIVGGSRYRIQTLPHNGILDENGVYIGYSRVEEETTGLGKHVFTYTNFDQYPDVISSEADNYTINDRSFMRGLLVRDETFTASGAPLTAKNILYNFEKGMTSYLIRNTIEWKQTISWSWDCSCGFLCSDKGGLTFNYNKRFELYSAWVTREITEVFDRANASKKKMGVTRYDYDLLYVRPRTVTTYDSALLNRKYVTRYKYVTDEEYWPADASTLDNVTRAIQGMVYRNQHNVVVEEIHEQKEPAATYVLSSNVTKYSMEGTTGKHAHAQSQWSMNAKVPIADFLRSNAANGVFTIDSRLRETQTFDAYNQTTGNLERMTSPVTGLRTDYAWDARNLSIASTTLTGGGTSLTKSSANIPLVGISSTTDANGRVTTQEYDVYSRPSVVRDHDNNIISRTRYHYRNETPGFWVQANRVEELMGRSISFDVVDVAASVGEMPYFVWDMGDGTVYDGDRRSVDHAYSAAGVYTVKVTALHSLYGAVTRTKTITVRPPMTATMCANGPLLIDLCGKEATVFGECTTTQNTTLSDLELTITPANGCASSYSYVWEFKFSLNSNWQSLPSTTNVGTYRHQGLEGTFDIRCTVTDACGNRAQYTRSIQLYRSIAGCPTDIKK